MYLIDVVERFDMYDLMYIHFSLSLSLSLVQTQLLALTLMLTQMSRLLPTVTVPMVLMDLPTLKPIITARLILMQGSGPLAVVLVLLPKSLAKAVLILTLVREIELKSPAHRRQPPTKTYAPSKMEVEGFNSVSTSGLQLVR